MREQRKVVTVLFADVVGSTALAAQTDPEVVRSQMARYFKRVTDISEAYGGTVEKFAGDAAMVVFGVPTVHDDDAERAVRAALDIRDGAAELAVRVGVNTGEAVTAAREDRQFMVSGDAVNTAARLQQGAESGEVVVGALTHQLTRTVIEYEARQAVTAKGKPEPLLAFRALRPRTTIPAQARGVSGLHAALVGRSRELRLLLDTFARSAEDRRPHLFTLVGAAGVGKSRLVGEALSTLAGSGARLLRGRCLPYGRGVTYWPLKEMLLPDTGIGLADERDVALAKLDRWLGELLLGDSQRPAIRARLAVMMGFETPTTGMPDTPADRVDREIGWGIRHYLEAVARGGPLIVVVDDLQWAEPPVIEIVEQLAERSVDVPMLLICIARPEFLEARRDWGSGKPNSTTITLDPLNPEETGTLISRLLEIEALPANLRAQIIERSAGTPLFCEEFIQMLIDDGRLVRDGSSWRAMGQIDQIEVPHSIQAVLAARLDGLPDNEKGVLQAASVIGERFEAAQVRELVGGTDPEAALESLRRKGLVVAGDRDRDELRFRHLLIRDAAYSSLTKSERAALHDRFGSLLEREAGDPQQLTEILAHHAERALTLSIELGVEGELLAPRARRALDWWLASGDRAITRRDVAVVAAALQTARVAAGLLPDGGGLPSRARLALLEAQRLMMTGDYAQAARAAAEAAGLAEQAGLARVVATARLTEAWIANWTGMQSLEEFDRVVQRAVEACRQAGDDAGEIEALHIGTNHLYSIGLLGEFIKANERLLEQARTIGDSARIAAILMRLASSETNRGELAAADRYLADAEALAAQTGLRNVALQAHLPRGTRLLLTRDLHGAEQVFRQYLVAARDAGVVQQQVSALRFLGYALLWQDLPAPAAEALDQALALSESSGERWNRAELLALRARAALELGDIPLAENFMDRALAMLRDDDVTAVSEVYHHLGMIRAARGRDAEAEASLRRSLEAVRRTDYHWPTSNSTLALAEFLAQRGRITEAAALVAEREGWIREHELHLWDPQIAEVRNLITAATRS
ncbi:MAG TPA: adenylate/guanylate cyclase domain-containing protein [Candidatus Eisenbacteria bacterium]|nr:adenylate/guanylate cyclase domain-containing protein [Candidatus Eisenbacteria bacterium]